MRFAERHGLTLPEEFKHHGRTHKSEEDKEDA